MKKVLVKFIKDNKLSFEGSGSGLNSECCILAGFCLYKEIEDVNFIVKTVVKICNTNLVFTLEFERVFKYAEEHNYGDFWTSNAAKKMYVIE
jgi:hypothetical protein